MFIPACEQTFTYIFCNAIIAKANNLYADC